MKPLKHALSPGPTPPAVPDSLDLYSSDDDGDSSSVSSDELSSESELTKKQLRRRRRQQAKALAETNVSSIG